MGSLHAMEEDGDSQPRTRSAATVSERHVSGEAMSMSMPMSMQEIAEEILMEDDVEAVQRHIGVNSDIAMKIVQMFKIINTQPANEGESAQLASMLDLFSINRKVQNCTYNTRRWPRRIGRRERLLLFAQSLDNY
mmetsp:Transcript_10067/g.18317  ORF Transcript_10067/g.18317 Transcript_10067/m.18317 type:complete len:135 (+) Transcript_10067:44-448(+)